MRLNRKGSQVCNMHASCHDKFFTHSKLNLQVNPHLHNENVEQSLILNFRIGFHGTETKCELVSV